MAAQWPPRKNAAYIVRVPFYGGGPVPLTGLTGFVCNISKDEAAFGACTNNLVEIGNSGAYVLTLTADEMNCDRVTLRLNSVFYGALLVTIDTIAVADLSTVMPLAADVAISVG